MSTRPAPPSVLVTGLGAATPYGRGVDRFWQGLLEGRDAIRPLTLFAAEDYAVQQGGQCPDDCLEALQGAWPGVQERATLFALDAVAEALRDAGPGPAVPPGTALVAATNFGGLARGEALLAATVERASPDDAWCDADFARPAAVLRGRLGLTGPCTTLSLSCASGAAALAHAALWIAEGRVERAVVVGYDALSRVAWAGLCALRTQTTDRVRPFDKNRSGTIFSEGAAALLLESEAGALARGARPLARLSGWATGNNGTHMTAPAPGGAGSADVLRRALDRAGLAPEAVDHINAHGTGTRLNDSTEAAAFRTVFGARARSIPVTSIKGAVGHLLGAAGSAEAVATVLALREGRIPPTAHCDELDEACDLDVVRGEPRTAPLRCAISNSAGIGGVNAAVLFERAHEPAARLRRE